MRMRQLVTALALALSGAEVAALGFGEIEVRSRLNEPLDATIRVSGDAEELASLSVRLAAAEEFARLGLRRQAVAVALDFLVERDERGEAVVRVRSRQPVREPLLPLLVEAQWSRGRMLREFVVLLDPPLAVPAIVRAEPARVEEVAPARREPITEAAPEPRPEPAPEPVPEPAPPPVAGPEPAEAPPEQAPAPEPERAGPRPEEAPRPEPAPQPEAVAPPPPAPAPAPAEYGPVAAGETLWQIALGTRPADDVAVQQMLLALFEANPEAFIDGNVNLLRRGAVLRIPEAERVRAVDLDRARRMLAEHAEALAARRGTSRPVAMAAPAEPPPIIAEREARSAPPPPPREDRLAILPPAGEDRPPRAAAGGMPTRDAEIEALRADLQRSRESLAAAEQELGELRSRVRELEGIEADQQRLIALKDRELAALRERLAELEERLRREEGRTAAAESAPGPTEPAVAVVEPAPAEPPPAPEVAEAAPPPARVAPAAPQPPPVGTPPAEERSWYLDPRVLGAGGLGLALALGLAVLARRRRAAAEAANGGSLASRLVTATAAPAPPSAADRRQELRAAVEANPTDLAAHLALLRFLYNQEDVEGFEIAAESMAGYVGEGPSPEWQEVLAMGRELGSVHPLFRSAPEPRPAVPERGMAAPPEPEPPEPPAVVVPPPLQEAESPAPARPPEPEPEPFELPAWEPEPLAAAPAETPPAADEDERITQRLARADLGIPSPFDTQRLVQADIDRAMADRTPAASGVPLAAESEDDVVATKLDLAREYLDLGDAEGARGLLEEVLAEGSPAQKAEAQRLLAQIR